MLVIRDPNSVPDERWNFPVQSTGFTVYAPNWPALYSEIELHCKANSVQPPSLQEVVDYCCVNLHVNCYDDQTREPLVNKLTLGIPHSPTSCCSKSK